MTISRYYFRHKTFICNFAWQVLQVFGKQGMTFLIFFLSAKLLSPYDFGVYSYILGVVYLFVVFSDFGISSATSKYVTEYNLLDKKKLEKVLFNAILVIMVLGVITFGTLMYFKKYLLVEVSDYTLCVLPLLFLIPLTSLYDGVYRGLKQFKKLSLITTMVGLCCLAPIFLLIENFSLFGALISQVLFYMVLMIALIAGYRNVKIKYDFQLIKTLLSYSLLIGVANVGYFLYTKIDIIILGNYGFITEIGHYEIINKIFAILIMPAMIMATVVAPNTTERFVLNKRKNISKKIFKESLILFIVGLGIATLVYCFHQLFFRIFLIEYDALLMSQILIPLLFLIPIRYFSSYINIGYITPSGFVKILTVTTLFYGVLNAVLDLVLIEKYGFIGVIYATLISQALLIMTTLTMFIISISKKNEKRK
ncbi:oligosaccharide flippase family protein [bacterium]|jgi:O-antigen/teichoic acid export membrane protein|nr:oligosaccharide flippase family protein [bacterium]MBT4251272.1 oligosaccharide flippase family protein [bacterium]MBT4598347.1 oligosaccharide flippase family protein [bacterium]MBT6754180.1 oligosaccharide flippase family protein [bacterium]MBT7037238.1 oligosaccharide flippase family protein [bacterium]